MRRRRSYVTDRQPLTRTRNTGSHGAFVGDSSTFSALILCSSHKVPGSNISWPPATHLASSSRRFGSGSRFSIHAARAGSFLSFHPVKTRFLLDLRTLA
jgi:hypothetical protein